MIFRDSQSLLRAAIVPQDPSIKKKPTGLDSPLTEIDSGTIFGDELKRQQNQDPERGLFQDRFHFKDQYGCEISSSNDRYM